MDLACELAMKLNSTLREMNRNIYAKKAEQHILVKCLWMLGYSIEDISDMTNFHPERVISFFMLKTPPKAKILAEKYSKFKKKPANRNRQHLSSVDEDKNFRAVNKIETNYCYPDIKIENNSLKTINDFVRRIDMRTGKIFYEEKNVKRKNGGEIVEYEFFPKNFTEQKEKTEETNQERVA